MKTNLLAFLCLFSANLFAQTTLTKDGVKYILNADLTATIDVQSSTTSGSIFIPSTIEDEGKTLYKVTKVGMRAFMGCGGLTEVVFEEPTNLKSLDQGCFNGTGLVSLNIPEGVTIVAPYIIQNSKVQELIISNSVTSLGNIGATTALKTITIGSGVSNIVGHTFKLASALRTIKCHRMTPPTVAQTSFDGLDLSQYVLMVSTAAMAAYKAATPWKTFGTILDINDVDPNRPVFDEFLNLSYNGLYRIYLDESQVLAECNARIVTEPIRYLSHTQLWQPISNTDSTDVYLQNYHSKQVISMNDQGLYPAALGNETMASLLFYLSVPSSSDHAGYLFPTDQSLASPVILQSESSSLWTFELLYTLTATTEVPVHREELVTSLPENTQDLQSRPFTQCGNTLTFQSPCYVYNLMGVRLADNVSTQLTLNTGVYIVVDAEEKASWKTLID